MKWYDVFRARPPSGLVEEGTDIPDPWHRGRHSEDADTRFKNLTDREGPRSRELFVLCQKFKSSVVPSAPAPNAMLCPITALSPFLSKGDTRQLELTVSSGLSGNLNWKAQGVLTTPLQRFWMSLPPLLRYTRAQGNCHQAPRSRTSIDLNVP
jgi:hypothetical protein